MLPSRSCEMQGHLQSSGQGHTSSTPLEERSGYRLSLGKQLPIDPSRSLEDGHAFSETGKRSFWESLLMTFRLRSRRVNPDASFASNDDFFADVVSEKKLSLRKPDRWRMLFMSFVLGVFVVFGIIHVIDFVINLGPFFWDSDADHFLPQWGRAGQIGEGLSVYPTDFTRDVIPIPCHSHNDYWRRIPLFEAIHYGCTGVEADVWLFDEELFVGHNTASLTRNRTLRNLYIKPLVELLDKQNPSNHFANASHHGVFDEDPNQTLTLLIDFKNSGSAIWHYVQEQIGALREKGYLTYFDGTTVISGPVTIVATGNAPFDLLTVNTTHRDVFFDAPLDKLWEEPSSKLSIGGAGNINTPLSPRAVSRRDDAGQGSSGTGAVSSPDAFSSANSYYASVSFRKSIGMLWRGRLTEKQTNLIRGQIRGAKRRGLKTRYWSTPSWPIGLRNHVWEVLVREGADYLNVDDLRAAARTDWRRSRRSQ